jgi:hypothetical protein
MLERVRTAAASVTRGEFRLTELSPAGKNQLFKLTSADGECVLKVFPETEHGYASARREFNLGQALPAAGIGEIPERRALIDGVVVMDYLPDPSPPTSAQAYGWLADFLRRTDGLELGERVADDRAESGEYSALLTERLEHLRIGEALSAELAAGVAELRADSSLRFAPVPSRLAPADFTPEQMVWSRGRLYLVDLEDCGMSDPCRFACNLFLHPRSRLTAADLGRTLDQLGAARTRFDKVFRFSYMEWILILLNCFSDDRFHRGGRPAGETEKSRRLGEARRRLDLWRAARRWGDDLITAHQQAFPRGGTC